MENTYVPVHSVSFTGLFPGFAKPHFVPEDIYRSGKEPNTLYTQQVSNGRIVDFEPIEDFEFKKILLADTLASFSIGDPAVYSYAFGPEDAVVGPRDLVARVIEQRFQEIEMREFAACTAAQFAGLDAILPQVNKKAFGVLAQNDVASARQWRDSVVFASALRPIMNALQISPVDMRLRSRDRSEKLEVALSFLLEALPQARRSRLVSDCRNALIRTGLFHEADVLKINLEPDARSFSPQLPFEPAELNGALEDAKQFLEKKVFLPALRWSRASDRTANVVRDTRYWISRFEKVGDLVRYMDRFRPDTRQSSLPFIEIRQIRFEDVYAEFAERFGKYRGFTTTVADFKEGERYSAFALSIYTRTYNNRGAGIRPVGKTGAHEAVVVNVTLEGGRYHNRWLEPGKRLKCYLKAPLNRNESHHEEDHDANKAIMKFPHIPVLVFTREMEKLDFLYNGIFTYVQLSADEGGKWFELVKCEDV